MIKKLASIFLLGASVLSLGEAGAAEINVDANGNIIADPNAWRKLSDGYSDEVRELRRKRAEQGEKIKSLEDELNAVDFAKVSEEAERDFNEGLKDMASSLGEAATDYFKGPGKRDNILDAGNTIITETLPALNQAYDAMFAEVDLHFEMERINDEIVRYEKEAKEFDDKIIRLEDNIKVAEDVARFLESDFDETELEVSQATTQLQGSASSVKEKAQEKVDTVPEGWTECTCPDAHSNEGRIIHGKRYHGPGKVCPQ